MTLKPFYAILCCNECIGKNVFYITVLLFSVLNVMYAHWVIEGWKGSGSLVTFCNKNGIKCKHRINQQISSLKEFKWKLNVWKQCFLISLNLLDWCSNWCTCPMMKNRRSLEHNEQLGFESSCEQHCWNSNSQSILVSGNTETKRLLEIFNNPYILLLNLNFKVRSYFKRLQF